MVRSDPAKLDSLRELAFTHTKNLPNLITNLEEIEKQTEILGETGALMKRAETLYDDLKLSQTETWPFLLNQRKITSRANYYWYGREWRSKTAAIVVAAVLIGAFVLGVYKLWTPENRGRYYVWRIEKANNTDRDRFRAGRELMSCLHETRNPYPSLTALLRFEGVPVRIAENVLMLLVESREIASTHQVELPLLLADSLRTSNPDIRTRVHAVLLYLAEERKTDVGTLKDWKPSAKDSSTDIDSIIKQWKHFFFNDTATTEIYTTQLCLKSPGSEISLCKLCVSVVYFCSEFINHRDTENTEFAQRREIFGLLGQSPTTHQYRTATNS